MKVTNVIRKTVGALSVVIVASALIGAAAWQHAKDIVVTLPAGASAAPASMVGVPTGEYQEGVPVYRLPSITVTVNRSEALAKMARSDSQAVK